MISTTFSYWIGSVKNFFVSLNSVYKYKKEIPKPRSGLLCPDTIDLEYDRELRKAHANVPKKSKLQLKLEYILKLVFTLTLYGCLVYFYRRK